ncbi:BamA/TamA family outer membrane protein [Leptolyngbya sp. FACHB-17]|uniref:BamA/TamA family outer membrane protein n=1 Tax=unclassified Leptolyngbya TaxID=2650499 RepID=UPI0016817256|nr:BamA/TamA family outer membrane protein [Leptolyngbya sp. FACHB-17]MBD2082991.1 BamA/TamA family outer membrane protein [Leptolyngbya sp. FACHB-17]
MRFSTLTACTIGLISASNSVQKTVAQDVVVPEAITPIATQPSVASSQAVPSAVVEAPRPTPEFSRKSSQAAQSIVPPQAQTPRSQQTPPRSPSPASPTPPDVVLTATDVQIVGASAELQQLVRAQLQTQPGGNVSTAQLQRDIATILETGLFSTATFTTRTNPNGLSVVFQVQPAIVRALNLVNAQALTPTIANQFFQAQFGAPVSPTAINESIRQVNTWYRQNGFSLARVIGVVPNREGVLTVEVAEGTVSNIQIRFTDEQGRPTNDKGEPIRGRTRESFLQTQIQLKPGQIFQESVARQDLQRIFQTGLFTNGRISLEGDARRTTVVYNLTEARSRALNVSGGINDDLGVFGSFSYNDNNFNGVGQQLGSNVSVGTRDVQFDGRFVSPYRETEPDKLGYSASGFRRRGISRVFDDDTSRLANGDRVREGRFGGTVAVNRPIGEGWNGTLGVNYTRVSLRDQGGNVVRRDRNGAPLSFSGTGIDDLTTVNFTAVRDQRNNPVDPSSGSILSLTTEQSIPIGRGSILSNRLQANYSQYIPVNFFNLEKTQNQPEVLAFNVQAGTTIGDLPPYNAFSLGGANSVRGYDISKLGIGRSFVLASAEYRFPIYSIIGGAVFADFGSDLGSANSVLGAPGEVRGLPGTGFGFGVGLRLKSPLGTIRAGYGINNQGESRLQFGFGEKF